MATWLTVIAKVFYQKGAPLYLVGGAVRNQFLNLPIEDYDICGPLTANEVEKICEGTPVKTLGKISSYGTIALEVEDEQGKHQAEYTTFRQDFYEKGHKPSKVVFTSSLEKDSFRRDFSINALYRPLTPKGLGDIIDPTGGIKALQNRQLHTVTQNPYTILKDDGLRILRMVRFSCSFSLTPSPSLLKTAKEQSLLLKDIAPERLQEELNKILLSDFRYPLSQNPIKKALAFFSSIPCYPYLFPLAKITSLGENACIHYPPSSKALPYRILLLLWGNSLEIVESTLSTLRYSKALIHKIVNTFGLLEQVILMPKDFFHTNEPLWLLVQKGEEVAQSIPSLLIALQEEEKALQVSHSLHTIEKNTLPWSLKDLAITGHHLLPLLENIPSSTIGFLLTALHQAVIMENIPNQIAPLIEKAKSLLSQPSFTTENKISP